MERIVALAIVVAGCGRAGEPSLVAIEPDTVAAVAATPAVLHGEALYGIPRVRLAGDPGATVDTSWTVAVDDTAITAQWISAEEIDVTVPAGLAIGAHTVTAISPAGDRVPLAGGLTVTTDGREPDAGGDAGGDGGSDELTVATDPFGDGTALGYLTAYAGAAYLGPDATGTHALRVADPGTTPDRLAFAFAADTGATPTANNSAAPYPSIGATGCSPNSAACGPNNENSHGVFAAGTIGADGWLIAAGANTGGSTYLYATTDTTGTLGFRYLDLSTLVDASTAGWSAIGSANGILYAGAVATSGHRPALYAIATAPTAPGVDETDATVTDLHADVIPGLSTSSIARIDAITTFAGRLYIANGGAWWRATVAAPRAYTIAHADWAVVTPSAAAYAAHESISSTKRGDLAAADRAVSAFAEYGGQLWAARNTEDGPQLWTCVPATSGDVSQCDPDDWELAGSADSAATAITLLAATPSALYVGIDRPNGARVFRTTSTDPSAADFTLVGTPGFGDATRTQILDGKTIATATATRVWLLLGNGTDPLALVVLP
ncbi:MAG TPA: hypothetical protein VGM88_28390 [Kofleriaceae bacterium]